MAFEVYKPRIEKEATIAISKNHLTLNKKLLDKINTKHVELAYDPETRIIRIKPSGTDNGLVLNRNKIGARGFFKHFKIDQKGKYGVVFKEEERAFYIQI